MLFVYNPKVCAFVLVYLFRFYDLRDSLCHGGGTIAKTLTPFTPRSAYLPGPLVLLYLGCYVVSAGKLDCLALKWEALYASETSVTFPADAA